MSELPGFYVAGEVVGGANGANRLSGNAITEALVFGRRAGRSAAAHAAQPQKLRPQDCRAALDLLGAPASGRDTPNGAAMIARLQAVMAADIGPFRTAAKLRRALSAIAALKEQLGERPAGSAAAFDLQRLDWLDLRNMIAVAQAVAQSALNREESRGAHQREDFPAMLPQWQLHQSAKWRDGTVHISGAPAEAMA
jgi:succinate dehydrogenase / fumarate reductase flavoprotein subunit